MYKTMNMSAEIFYIFLSILHYFREILINVGEVLDMNYRLALTYKISHISKIILSAMAIDASLARNYINRS